MISFKEFITEMAFHMEVGNGLANSANQRKSMYNETHNLLEHSRINTSVSVHRLSNDKVTEYHTLDHRNKESLHYCTIHKDSSPINCEVQTGVSKAHSEQLPKHHATNVVYNHFKQSKLPLRSDKIQSNAGHKLWHRLVTRALGDGHHVYYHDGNKLHKTNKDNVSHHLESYFGDEADSHPSKHMILSKDIL
jgi:hypothetical protein